MERAKPRRTTALVGLGLGLALLSGGGPALLAALAARDADPALNQFYAGNILAAPDRDAAIAALNQADFWQRDARRAIIRAFLTGGPAEALQSALAGAPGEPSAWFLLARQRLERNDRGGAAAALRLSLLAGAMVPPLMVPRLDMIIALQTDLPPDIASMLARQVRLTWVIAPEAVLIRLNTPGAAELIIPALADLSLTERRQTRHQNRIDGSDDELPNRDLPNRAP